MKKSNQASPNKKLILITKEYDQRRADQALATLTNRSRSYINRLINRNLVTKEGDRIKASQKVKAGDKFVVCFDLPAEKVSAHTTVELPKQIVYEDDNIIVINKWSGQVVHPGPGQRTGTITQALVNYQPRLAKIERAGLVHRLDKETSGVLLIAKDTITLMELKEQFTTRSIKKIYYCLCAGKVVAGRVEQPIARHPKKRFLRAIVSTGKEAITDYHPENTFHHGQGQYTLLRVEPRTGRTHQIRVHLQHQGHPILGDSMYNNKESRRLSQELNIKRVMLHAKSLTFFHPLKNKEFTVTTDWPADFSTFLTSE